MQFKVILVVVFIVVSVKYMLFSVVEKTQSLFCIKVDGSASENCVRMRMVFSQKKRTTNTSSVDIKTFFWLKIKFTKKYLK